MTEKEKQIILVFSKALPLLSYLEKEKLLSFAEGIAFKAEQMKAEEAYKMIEENKEEEKVCSK